MAMSLPPGRARRPQGQTIPWQTRSCTHVSFLWRVSTVWIPRHRRSHSVISPIGKISQKKRIMWTNENIYQRLRRIVNELVEYVPEGILLEHEQWLIKVFLFILKFSLADLTMFYSSFKLHWNCRSRSGVHISNRSLVDMPGSRSLNAHFASGWYTIVCLHLCLRVRMLSSFPLHMTATLWSLHAPCLPCSGDTLLRV